MRKVMESDRIVLRPWQESDAGALFKYASDPEVGPRAGWPPHKSVEESLEVIRGIFSGEGMWAVVLKSTGEAIGCAGYLPSGASNLAIEEDQAEVGYWIARPYWDQGICTEALRMVIDYCFNEKGFSVLWGDFFPSNPASGRVMEKCGFRDTGRETLCPNLQVGSDQPVRILRLDRNQGLGMDSELLRYSLDEGVEAFSTRRESVLPYPVVQGHQVHGAKVAVIDRPGLTRADLEGYDAFVTDLPGVAIGVRTADCVPVLLYDPRMRAVAAVHCGWRGTVQGISHKAINIMEMKYGCDPQNLKVVIGPGIGPESFQVGEEVALQFKQAGFPMDDIWSFRDRSDGSPMSGGHHIDLFKANRWLLEQAGVDPANIQVCGIDTYTDQSFFSARREGASCGRIINSIKLLSV